MKSSIVNPWDIATVEQYNNLRIDAEWGSFLKIVANDTPNGNVNMQSGIFYNSLWVEVIKNSPVSITGLLFPTVVWERWYILISINDAGTIVKTYSASAAFPVRPTVPTGQLPLAYILLAYAETTIADTQIEDARGYLATRVDSYSKAESDVITKQNLSIIASGNNLVAENILKWQYIRKGIFSAYLNLGYAATVESWLWAQYFSAIKTRKYLTTKNIKINSVVLNIRWYNSSATLTIKNLDTSATLFTQAISTPYTWGYDLYSWTTWTINIAKNTNISISIVSSSGDSTIYNTANTFSYLTYVTSDTIWFWLNYDYQNYDEDNTKIYLASALDLLEPTIELLWFANSNYNIWDVCKIDFKWVIDAKIALTINRNYYLSDTKWEISLAEWTNSLRVAESISTTQIKIGEKYLQKHISKSLGVNYKAGDDWFVIWYIVNTNTTWNCSILLYSDSAATPTTLLCSNQASWSSGTPSICAPIRKWDYYRVDSSWTIVWSAIKFIPFT